jgi:predicted transglutaminase-like cysteine proteinase
MLARPAAQRQPALAALLLALAATLQIASVSGLIEFQKMLSLAEKRYGQEGVESVTAWQAFIADSAPLPVAERLRATNDFFNSRVRWSTDRRIYGSEDYWATPLETLGRLQADCEDFTIAKYITLIHLGVAPESLRLVYVKARLPGGTSQAHMVLAWYETPGAMPLILDNINGRVLPASQRPDLTPIFSFNADDLWVSGSTRPSTANPRARLSRWQQVLERMASEGVRDDL